MIIEVSLKNVIARFNRAMKKDYRAIRKSRAGSGMRQIMGEYYLVDTYHNEVKDWRLTPSRILDYAREAGCVAANERISGELA